MFTTRRGGLFERSLREPEPGAADRRPRRGGRPQPSALVAELGLPALLHPPGSRDRRAAASTATAQPTGAPAWSAADGQATAAKGFALMVMVADCLPIALAGEGAVAMLHAGWRGLAGGIIAEGVRGGARAGRPAVRLRPRRSGRAPVRAATRWARRSTRCSPALRTGASGARPEPGPQGGSPAASSSGPGSRSCHDIGLCTMCADPTLLFSHRRDRGVTGAPGRLAWLSLIRGLRAEGARQPGASAGGDSGGGARSGRRADPRGGQVRPGGGTRCRSARRASRWSARTARRISRTRRTRTRAGSPGISSGTYRAARSARSCPHVRYIQTRGQRFGARPARAPCGTGYCGAGRGQRRRGGRQERDRARRATRLP